MLDGYRRLHPATIIVVLVDQVRRLAGVVFLAVAVSLSKGNFDSTEIYAAVIGLIAILPAFTRYLTVRYRITSDALEIKSGWIFRQDRTIPLERIQNVTVMRNIVHRALGVAKIKVETASGHQHEASLDVVANSDVHAIEMALRRTPTEAVALAEGEVAPPPTPIIAEPPIYRASFRELALAGATGNRALLIVATAMVLANSTGMFRMMADSGKQVGSTVSHMGLAIWLIASIALGGLFVIGWIGNITGTILKYFDFKIFSHEGVFKLEHGLLNQIRTAIPMRRIQTVVYRQRWLQRKLGFGELGVTTAASYEEKHSQGLVALAPAIAPDAAARLSAIALPHSLRTDYLWHSVSPKTWYREAIGMGWVTLIVAGAVYATSSFNQRHPADPRWLYLMVPFYVALATGCYFGVRSRQYAIDDEYLVRAEGILGRRITVVPLDRIQQIRETQTVFQRRWGVATMGVLTASSGMSLIVVSDLEADECHRLCEFIAQRSAAMQTGGL